MQLSKKATAGTLESGDILIEIEPNQGNGIEIDLTSSVERLYGRQIRLTITETLAALQIFSALVTATDKGALDCAIRARLTTAVLRASECTEFSWQGRQQDDGEV